MAGRAAQSKLQRSLKWIPSAIVAGLFLFAWGTLTWSLAVSYNIARRGRWLYGLFEVLVTQVLSGLAFGSYLLAILRDPGSPGRQGPDGWDGDRDLEEHGGRSSSGRDDDADGALAPLLPEVNAPLGQPSLPARSGRQQLADHARTAQAAQRIKASGLMVKSSGDTRWCNKCDTPKPDRAHHCSTCGVCVLRMDHHCPWLASSCVGLRNHKPFFLFLFYTSLFCAYAAQEAGRALVGFVMDEPDGFETSPLSWAIVLFIGFIFGVALIPFTGYHAFLICRNRTTLESMEGQGRIRVRPSGAPAGVRKPQVETRLMSLMKSTLDRAQDSATPGHRAETGWRSDEVLTREERKVLKKAAKVNIYDLGASENWKQIMGRTPMQWFLPWGQPESDGFTYVVDAAKLRQLQRVTSTVREEGSNGMAD